MVKSIIKETLIMLLLCIAIVLLLFVLFYDYIPTNKVIPTKEAYYTQDKVKEELNEQITEIQKTEISYEITDADLTVYEQTSSYKPGKKDPFSLEETAPAEGNNNTSTGTNNNNQNNSNGQTSNDTNTVDNTNKNTTETFFNDEGIK